MKPKKHISAAHSLRERIALQDRIREKFGDKAIEKAKERLCTKCVQQTCLLLPICSDGKDCPYFKQKEVEK